MKNLKKLILMGVPLTKEILKLLRLSKGDNSARKNKIDK